MANDPKKNAEEIRRREAELDRFWSIDAILPRRAPAPPSPDTDTVEIEVPAEPSAPAGETTVIHPAIPRLNLPKGERFIPPHRPGENAAPVAPLTEYEPEGFLLHRVRVYPWRSSYRYYEEFAQTAERWNSLPGRPSPAVPFFSYVPQYAQMRREQVAFYLWWRDCLRRGEPIPADYSYVLLYVYELINLSEKLPPAEVQAGLVSVWRHYIAAYPQLANFLSEWICDHGLINRLGPPAVGFSLLSDLTAHCSLKDYYVSSGRGAGLASCLLAFACNYDFHKSKFCAGENRPLFEKTVPAVLRMVTTGAETGKFFAFPMSGSRTVKRDAYSGALCSYRIKRKIEVDCSSFFCLTEMRQLVTDTVKYTENALRAHLGVRTRLSIYALPTPIRAAIDAYFNAELPPKKREAPPPEKPEYEKLYDLPQKPFSARDAAEIERLSWDTTKRLVEAFGEEPEAPETPAPEPVPQPEKAAPATAPEPSPFAPYLPFLLAVREGNAAGQRAAADALGKLTDAVADEVNRLAADHLGDILLEEGENGYGVIEDYRPDLEELIAALS